MYTNSSKFRIKGKYGSFTIPKGILSDNKWASGDLIGFWGLDGEVIHIERMDQDALKDGKYNKEVYKKIAKFGGHTGTCGIKSLPEFLMKEFKPKDGQTMYFLPAKYTFLEDYYSQQELENIVFATFDSKQLEIYGKNKQFSKKEVYEEHLQSLIDKYHLPFFNKKLDTSGKNSDKSKRKVKRINKIILKKQIFGLENQIEEIKAYKKQVQASKHPKKKEILKNLSIDIKSIELEKEELKENATPMFEEWTKEETKILENELIKRKRNRIENIKWRNRNKN